MMDLSQWLTTGGAVTALGVALATYIRTRPAMKAEQTKGEVALWQRIVALEAKLDAERAECDRRIDELKETITDLQGQVQIQRHERNNFKQLIAAMIALLEQDNPDLQRIISSLKDMMHRGEEQVALEKGAMRRKI